MQNRNIYNNITIIITLNLIYNDFETKTSNLLKTNKKTINKIQQIVNFVKAKNLSKQATGITNNIIILVKKSKKGYNNNNYLKKKNLKASNNK